MAKNIIIIPTRLSSTRLPNKAIADIGGKPMILRVMELAMKTGIDDVYVAAPDQEIIDMVEKVGGRGIITSHGHPSGTDRVYEAITKIDPDGKFDNIINLQGDLPVFDPAILNSLLKVIDVPGTDVATLATILTAENAGIPSMAKAVLTMETKDYGRALYFSRSPVPYNASVYYHHIGVYCYKRHAIAKFVQASPSALEVAESLEQLRALELGLSIRVAIVNSSPYEVNTIDDLNNVRNLVL
jgi:3-deoxy-manno-octulosonate cytidylyltransferase (CMP-KDO synthetase)